VLSQIPSPSLHCLVQVEGGTVTITPEGELDVATVPLLEAAMESQRHLGAGTLVVDLRGLTFIDSAGVHLLLRWARRAARTNRAFRVIPGAERVQLVLAMTGVLEALGFDERA
jgi:anti-sigma B factor antagonist